MENFIFGTMKDSRTFFYSCYSNILMFDSKQLFAHKVFLNFIQSVIFDSIIHAWRLDDSARGIF